MKKIILLFALLLYGLPCNSRPVTLRDAKHGEDVFSYAIGPFVKYKRVSGPDNFGGDMNMWGLRFMAGQLNDPLLGVSYSAGHLTGHSQKLKLSKFGLVMEDSFREDSRVKWRATFGGGTYRLWHRISDRTASEGSFAFFEPAIAGIIPLSRHISLEFSTGYTFTRTTGVRIEGLMLQAEFLLGRI